MSAPETVAGKSIGEFLETLAGPEATPGGGSVTLQFDEHGFFTGTS